MTRRTRKTPTGKKTRFRRVRDTHGPITRLVGDTPMKTLGEAALETLRAEHPALMAELRSRGDLVCLASQVPQKDLPEEK